MLKNYIKIAFRNLIRQKGYSFINIAGLAIGMTSCILIFLYVQDELKYDRHHEKGRDIYRIALDASMGEQKMKGVASPAPMANAMVEEIPEVLQAVRLFKIPNESSLVQYKENRFNEDRLLFADSTIFKVFTIPMVQGDPDKALSQPNSIVVTEEIAQKYFGDENPMDKYITIKSKYFRNETEYKVTGVVKTPPKQSHIEFDFLVSMTSIMALFQSNLMWLPNNFQTYVLLKQGVPYKQTDEKLGELVKKYVGPQFQQGNGLSFTDFLAAGNRYGYFLEPLFNIYLHSDMDNPLGGSGSAVYVYIFSLIAIFILLIACINFTNLATARSANRSKEVGIRKVMGSARSQLIYQFLTESVLLTFIAVGLALALVEVLVPYFNNLTGKELEFSLISSGLSIPGLIGVTLLVGILAGSYPAFFLSAFQPIAVLHGKASKNMKSKKIRSSLVIFQFSISIILFIGTLVVSGQMNYFLNKNLGFDREQVVVIPGADVLGDKGAAFKQELLQQPQITGAAFSSTLPGRNFQFWGFQPKDEETDFTNVMSAFFYVDEDFQTVYKLEIAAGQFFSKEISTDANAVVLNETAVRHFKFDNPIGNVLIGGGMTVNIIGVVKDFNFQSLHKKIEPVVMRYSKGAPNNRGASGFLSLRITNENVQETIIYIKNKWSEFVPNRIFDYYFLDDDYNRLYSAEQRMGKIFTIFSALAIFIAGLGLFGLASFTTEQRLKEIGVRKVLGASVRSILVLLSKETLILVLISTIIAWPVAYYFMDRWLQDFAYRINLSFSIFLFSSLAALFIGFITISYQAIKVATANPVESLRYE